MTLVLERLAIRRGHQRQPRRACDSTGWPVGAKEMHVEHVYRSFCFSPTRAIPTPPPPPPQPTPLRTPPLNPLLRSIRMVVSQKAHIPFKTYVYTLWCALFRCVLLRYIRFCHLIGNIDSPTDVCQIKSMSCYRGILYGQIINIFTAKQPTKAEN